MKAWKGLLKDNSELHMTEGDRSGDRARHIDQSRVRPAGRRVDIFSRGGTAYHNND